MIDRWNVIFDGSGGGIGMDGVTQPPTRPMHSAIAARRRMEPGTRKQQTTVQAALQETPTVSRAGRQRRWQACNELRRALHRRRQQDREARAEEQVMDEPVVVAEVLV